MIWETQSKSTDSINYDKPRVCLLEIGRLLENYGPTRGGRFRLTPAMEDEVSILSPKILHTVWLPRQAPGRRSAAPSALGPLSRGARGMLPVGVSAPTLRFWANTKRRSQSLSLSEHPDAHPQDWIDHKGQSEVSCEELSISLYNERPSVLSEPSQFGNDRQ